MKVTHEHERRPSWSTSTHCATYRVEEQRNTTEDVSEGTAGRQAGHDSLSWLVLTASLQNCIRKLTDLSSPIFSLLSRS